ncbi:MAG TPA: STAS domain-containing protein [Rhodocyclaceae bacterium]|nr:STAS domain-containing protein [Rhodocyclaceae bacterium]
MTATSPPQLAISGELTIFTANEIKQQLIAAITQPLREIEVDLSQVSEVDSAGLQLMVMAKREAAAHDKTLKFTHHSSSVLDILDLCDLSGFFGDPVLIRSQPRGQTS